MRIFYYIFLLIIVCSCNNTRYLPKGEELYTGSTVKIDAKDNKRDAKYVANQIERGMRPKPNTTFLFFFKPKLWYYNVAGDPKKEKGFRYWLKYKAGEPPVLFSAIQPQVTAEKIRNNVQNKGFFDPLVEYEIIRKNKKASVVYTVNVDKRYNINTVLFTNDSTELGRDFVLAGENTRLKSGSPYDLDVLKLERIRIDSLLKEKGYFYFDPDYILFRVDSLNGNATVDIEVSLKKELPSEAVKRYRINNVFIFPDYSLLSDTMAFTKDTSIVNNMYYITSDSTLYDKAAILRNIAFNKGDYYNRKDHNVTLQRFTTMGVFKFVNLRFRDADTALFRNGLDCYIYLMPLNKRALRLELLATSKSNDLAGPAMTLSYRDRNLFRGGELFIVNLNAGFETYINNRRSGFNSYKLGTDVKLFFPRFVVPFKSIQESDAFIPRTHIKLSYDVLSRIDFYRMNSMNTAYGYSWKESQYKTHELNPISITYLELGGITKRFSDLLERNILLRKSFEEQFIIGSTYSYTFNNRTKQKINSFYFNGNIDLSGNTLSLLHGAIGKSGLGGQSRIFGVPYAQYARIDFDFRHYLKLGRHYLIASRLITGVGVPYGNSSILPYSRQFFAGGVNSVRAFAARSLGPGSYRPDVNESITYFEQGGDIKIETSVEFRFDITRIVKGALFTDAGNVWLMNENPQLPGGAFSPGNILNEIGWGAGFGLRFDASIFVLRTDIAFPLMTPYGTRKVATRNTDLFGNNNNFTLNVAIGYPF